MPVRQMTHCLSKTSPQKRRAHKWNRDAHGSLYDRGRADSWYRRPADPHYYLNGSYNCITKLTPEEKAEYMAGYEENEEWGEHKEWD